MLPDGVVKYDDPVDLGPQLLPQELLDLGVVRGAHLCVIGCEEHAWLDLGRVAVDGEAGDIDAELCAVGSRLTDVCNRPLALCALERGGVGVDFGPWLDEWFLRVCDGSGVDILSSA